jgi:hypothetical protein
MAGWAALNRMLLERGALDGHYILPVAPHTRHGMYFKPFILPRWAMHLPDCNDYNGVLHWHNYIMRGTDWRSGKGGRSIRATNNQLAAMYVRRQHAINAHDLPNGSGASSSGDEPAAAQPAHRCGDRPPINDLNQARRQRPRAHPYPIHIPSLIPYPFCEPGVSQHHSFYVSVHQKLHKRQPGEPNIPR